MIINLSEPLYSYDRFSEDVKQLEKQYDKLIKCVTIGKSHDNRDIFLIKLGIGKRYLLCSAGVHGRETINPVVLLEIIEYYAELYKNHKEYKEQLNQLFVSGSTNLMPEYEKMIYGECISELLSTFTILLLPLLNPDGYMIALQGFDSIRDEKLRQLCINKNIEYYEWKQNARGVDINRNFPSRLWKEKFENDYPASENETKAFMEVCLKYPIKGFIDFHSRGKQIYYYRHMMGKAYNKRQLGIADQLKNITGYELVSPREEIEEKEGGGNTVHYVSERFLKPAITIETVAEEETFPLDYRLREEVFHEIKLVLFNFGSMIV